MALSLLSGIKMAFHIRILMHFEEAIRIVIIIESCILHVKKKVKPFFASFGVNHHLRGLRLFIVESI